MSVFNWIFWKKAIFTSGIVGLSLTPVAIIRKYGSASENLEISPLKKNLKHLTNSYAAQFTIPELAKEVLKMYEMKSSVEDVFAQDLALEAIRSSALYRQVYKEFEKEEADAFEKAFESFNTGNKSIHKFFDSRGGNREHMKRREMTKKVYELFKKEILAFSKENYILHTKSDQYKAIKRSYYLDKEIIDKTENWKHIGFFPDEDSKYDLDPNFFNSKFDFINFAHKKWFEDVRPFYVWMSLWKHKEKAHKSELASVWDEAKLKEKKVDLKEASYAFPYFETDDSKGLSSTSKFKKFFKDKVSTYTSNSTIFIPKGYTDDSATAIFVESKNMYSNLYIKFAAAANYKYQKKLEKLQNLSSNGKNINEFEKTRNTDVESYKQPTELFFFDKAGGGNNKAKIPILKEVIKEVKNQPKNEVADLVEIKDTPWVFIRNQAGIHAIAVDLENLDSKKASASIDYAYHHFQYRTLQLVYKRKLEITQTLDIQVDSVFKSFKDYLEQNFNKLILKYLFSLTNNKFFGASYSTVINDFKDAFQKMEDLEMLRNKYLFRIKLRESLLSTYAKTSWEVKDEDRKKKFDHPKVEEGLAGMLPYDLKTTNPTANQDNFVFEELEKLYDFDFFKPKPAPAKVNNGNEDKSLLGQYKKTEKEYHQKIDQYVEKLNLLLDQENSSLASDRIFSNNYHWNSITDQFLEKTELFNEFLFKYLMKTDYLGKSTLGNKGFISTSGDEADFSFLIPADYKNATEDNNFLEGIESPEDQDKTKKLFGKIDESAIQSYYSKQLLEKENVTPWDAVKYSGELLGELNGNDDSAKKDELRKKLHKLAKQSFEEKFVFGVDNFRSRHYKFLTSLTYLIRDGFKGFRNYVSSQISYDVDSYILFSNIKIDKHQVNLPENSFSNPFLKNINDNTEFKKDIPNINKYLSSVTFKDSKSKVSDGFIYRGLYSSKSSLGLSKEDRDSLNANSLYRYGDSAEQMNKYVLDKITTDAEFKKVVQAIKSATKSDATDWVEALEKDQIYIESTSGSTTTSEIRTLTLQEKKNLLSAVLNNVKTNITSDKIPKDKYKTTFLVDPANNYNSTGTKHEKKSSGNDHEEKFGKEKYFKNKEEVKTSDQTEKFKLFQINQQNLSSATEFKNFGNNKLSRDVFWAWVLNTALISEVQDLAVKDLGSSTDKIAPYDHKWVESGKDQFIKK
ncbi:hypothetical protein MHSWG343_04180 [Candidatus Mycoplasma haematohominis]|uniref:Uncharacterized protein n=1 Tax=Candidatus Mycoplasma haematohominis TaxID=1494318 RepID=A0A478FPS4_9MOLU|nr:hypothetical protein MHSWG343_04180 [Candidatus Mycoplasma haemohominis]